MNRSLQASLPCLATHNELRREGPLGCGQKGEVREWAVGGGELEECLDPKATFIPTPAIAPSKTSGGTHGK